MTGLITPTLPPPSRGRGTQVYKNGVPKSSVEGLAFKKVLFGIWIGGNPIQAELKKGMLGM